jgi:hypothetical protein
LLLDCSEGSVFAHKKMEMERSQTAEKPEKQIPEEYKKVIKNGS